jgi:hypothetical protein
MMVVFAVPGPERGGGWPLKILLWGTNFLSTTIQSKKMDKINAWYRMVCLPFIFGDLDPEPDSQDLHVFKTKDSVPIGKL